MKHWEIIAANLQNAGFSLGWVAGLNVDRRLICVVEARGYGKRFVVRADEMLIAFVELQRAIHEFALEFDRVIAARTSVRKKS